MKVLGVMKSSEPGLFGTNYTLLDAHCLLTNPEEIMMNEQKLTERLENNFNLGTVGIFKGHSLPSLIRTVHINEIEKIVVVVFNDGSKEIVKCSPNDEFDSEIGFSLAITRHFFGSKTQVRKLISKTAKVFKPKLVVKKRGKPAKSATKKTTAKKINEERKK